MKQISVQHAPLQQFSSGVVKPWHYIIWPTGLTMDHWEALGAVAPRVRSGVQGLIPVCWSVMGPPEPDSSLPRAAWCPEPPLPS